MTISFTRLTMFSPDPIPQRLRRIQQMTTAFLAARAHLGLGMASLRQAGLGSNYRPSPVRHRCARLVLALRVTHPYSGICQFGRLFVPDRDVYWVSLLERPARSG